MTTYSEVQGQTTTRSNLSLSLEIGLPWRFVAIGICLFGVADIVAIEFGGAVATTMFFTAYAAFAAALTLIITKSGR